MSKWDDDDDVPPPVVSTPKDVRANVADWRRSVTAAAQKAPVATAARPDDVKERVGTAFHFEGVEKPDPLGRPAPVSPGTAARVEQEARVAADIIARNAGTRRTVRLRTGVSGWYPGSVPAVDFPDDRGHDHEHHTFPMAPHESLETEDQYVRYWREPFVARLRELGFKVLELDL